MRTMRYNESFISSMMERAIELSKKGRGSVSPNPLVGCLIVKDDKIIGEGFHQEYGGAHAEQNALDNCVENPLGASAIITLEPCCIESKTPPCTKLLIDHGIDEVFIASRDPNPDINGKGVKELEKNGIHVYEGFLQKDVEKLNKGFFKWVRKGRPWVIVKVAQSSDGCMGIDNQSQTWITGEDSIENAHYLRSKVDAVLIGTQTARIDNPELTVRNVDGINPKRVVIDTNRTLPLDLKLYSDKASETIVMCSKDKFERNQTVNCKFVPVVEKSGFLDIEDILKKLANEGITSILIESGPKLIESFNSQNLVDELYIYTANNKVIKSNFKTPIDISSNWRLKTTKALGDDELQVFEREEMCLQE